MTGVDEDVRTVGLTLHRRTRFTCSRCREAVVLLVRIKDEDAPSESED